jgi:hypothetical protein
MTEEEFDALMQARPFGTADAMQAEAQMRRRMTLVATLGVALWGKTSVDLQHQLLKPYPELPSGFDLADFRELLHISAEMVSAILAIQKMAGLSPLVHSSTFLVGTQSLTLWEARCEIVRRAIEYLEKY